MSTPPQTTYQAHLVPQTGMPVNVVSRSRELKYDALQSNIRFIYNPFSPRPIYLSRPNQHW